MKKLSYKDKILDHMRKRPDTWFLSHELSQTTLDKGWVGTSGIRAAFSLWEDKLIEKDYEGKETKYKYKPQENIKYIPSYHSDGTVKLIQTKVLK
jgi:hypothetical protein